MILKNIINVFIVDDNRVFTMALKASIENAFDHPFIQLHDFETGEQCLEKLPEVMPELVILDYNLNSKFSDAADGIHILDKIKTHNPETNVIMLTSNDHIDLVLKSFHQGASDYIVKNENQFEKINDSISKIVTRTENNFKTKENAKKALDIVDKERNLEKEKRVEELATVNIQKAEFEKRKLIAEEKNKNITDSINYAKRIQLAKLPRKEEIYASLPQSFILFKPKDIVSGDFYFFHKTNQSVFIVAADCTGHGVPGAFMSMIGSEKLADAVAHNSDTSEILKHLNKGIKNSLHQSNSDESTRDGMDVAICSIDTEQHIVRYAGANRPLWIIRKEHAVVEEIKGTRKAIGGFTEDDQHFDSHELKLQAGDTFYIATDGYADQFGGESGKKLMTKKFKEILLDIQDKPMQEQKKHLNKFIENWKAEAEQVDDILVIGVRL
jgi:serine phosphatase RsbU (regulator of sigma subunit)